MKKRELLTLIGSFLFVVFSIYLLISVSDTTSADLYDNTSIESRVNVSNVGPSVKDVLLYEKDDGDTVSLGLEEGVTETMTCNATVDDLNGWSDISGVNATIYASGYTSSSPDDNNYHYFTSSCTNSSINASALKI